jgi:molybdopterin-guanine dinucleotide biosynthesis protein
MAIVIIGGHTRNIGKTSVMCRLISAFPECGWTAVKITQFGHGVCSANGEPCDCETADHTIAISEERNAAASGTATGTDSSRYLAAGAARSLWVRTRQGQLSEAMPRLRTEIGKAENTILESNSVLRFLRPDLYLAVLDPSVADFKPSALRYLDRADAVLYSGEAGQSAWPGVSPSLIAHIPAFRIASPEYWSDDVEQFVRVRLSGLADARQPAAMETS